MQLICIAIYYVVTPLPFMIPMIPVCYVLPNHREFSMSFHRRELHCWCHVYLLNILKIRSMGEWDEGNRHKLAGPLEGNFWILTKGCSTIMWSSFLCCVEHTGRYRYNVVNFFPISHNRHHIARLIGRLKSDSCSGDVMSMLCVISWLIGSF